MALPHLSEAFWGASGACKVNYRWKVKQLLPLGCPSPLPCSDEMSDKQQGRLGVCLHVKGGCKICVLAGPLGLSLGSRAQSCNCVARPKAAVPRAAVNANSSLMPKGEGLRFLPSFLILLIPAIRSSAFLTLVEYDSVFPLGYFFC